MERFVPGKDGWLHGITHEKRSTSIRHGTNRFASKRRPSLPNGCVFRHASWDGFEPMERWTSLPRRGLRRSQSYDIDGGTEQRDVNGHELRGRVGLETPTSRSFATKVVVEAFAKTTLRFSNDRKGKKYDEITKPCSNFYGKMQWVKLTTTHLELMVFFTAFQSACPRSCWVVAPKRQDIFGRGWKSEPLWNNICEKELMFTVWH